MNLQHLLRHLYGIRLSILRFAEYVKYHGWLLGSTLQGQIGSPLADRGIIERASMLKPREYSRLDGRAEFYGNFVKWLRCRT